MTLIIEPNTPKGDIQLQAIKWAEDQMNAVMAQYFNNKYHLIKGIKFNFKMRLDLKTNETIKVDLLDVVPETEERFKTAVEEAKSQLTFKANGLEYDKVILDEAVTPPNETVIVDEKGDQIGTDKK